MLSRSGLVSFSDPVLWRARARPAKLRADESITDAVSTKQSVTMTIAPATQLQRGLNPIQHSLPRPRFAARHRHPQHSRHRPCGFAERLLHRPLFLKSVSHRTSTTKNTMTKDNMEKQGITPMKKGAMTKDNNTVQGLDVQRQHEEELEGRASEVKTSGTRQHRRDPVQRQIRQQLLRRKISILQIGRRAFPPLSLATSPSPACAARYSSWQNRLVSPV